MLLKIQNSGLEAVAWFGKAEMKWYEIKDNLGIDLCKVNGDPFYNVELKPSLIFEPEIKPLYELIKLCIAELKS